MKFLITLDDLTALTGYSIAPRQLAIALRTSGHDCKVFCRLLPKVMFKGESKDDFIKLRIGDVINSRIIKRYGPDVIVSNSNNPTDLIALDYAYRNKVLSIAYVHSRIETLIKTRVFTASSWPQFLMNSVVHVMKTSLKNADVVIALSEELEPYLKRLFPTKPVEIISNGIDLGLFEYKKRKIDSDNINLLYIANLEPRKNQLFLLDVMEELPSNYHLHLVGGKEDPGYYNSFMKAFKKYKKKNITYHGKLDLSDVLPLYHSSHIFVNPSLMEAQSLVLMEAIATGLPIVRIYNDDNAGVTRDGITALHIEEMCTPSEFSSVIVGLVRDKDLYESITTNDKYYRDIFSIDSAAENLIKVVEKYRS